jgi:hypothetical protein
VSHERTSRRATVDPDPPTLESATLSVHLDTAAQFAQSVRGEVATHGGIGRQFSGAQGSTQVVVVQLNGPRRMCFVLRLDRDHQRRRQLPGSAGIGSDARAQYRDRIVTGSPGSVEPSFQRRHAEAHRLPADRMLPSALAQLLQCSLQMSLRRRRRQQWFDDGRAQSRPAIAIPSSSISHRSHPVSERRSTDVQQAERLSEAITSCDHHPLWGLGRRSGALAECARNAKFFYGRRDDRPERLKRAVTQRLLLSGARKRRSPWSREHRSSPSKRSNKLAGSAVSSIGSGLNRPRSILKSALLAKVCCHQRHQRSSVCLGTWIRSVRSPETRSALLVQRSEDYRESQIHTMLQKTRGRQGMTRAAGRAGEAQR